MRKFLSKLFFIFSYERLISILVNTQAIIHNLNQFSKRYDVAIAPVLKSNAYGHGLVEVGKIVDIQSIPFVCVDTFYEATQLRKNRVKKPIVIIGYTPLETILKNNFKNISFAVISIEELLRLKSINVRVSIHLKIDTGMHRHGILLEEVDLAMQIIKQHDNLFLEGVYSHFADADVNNSILTESQIENWNSVVRQIKEEIQTVKYFHCGQTAGSFYSNKLDANVVRLGIGLYGINSGLNTSLNLQLVLQIKTRITSIKTIKAGERIGYSGAHIVKRDTRVATIPMGYNEGIDRRLSDKGIVLVNGISCNILGRVSMNITSIDVSDVPSIQLDDEVVVISDNRSDENSIENIAKQCGTIPYEITVHFPESLQRHVM